MDTSAARALEFAYPVPRRLKFARTAALTSLIQLLCELVDLSLQLSAVPAKRILYIRILCLGTSGPMSL